MTTLQRMTRYAFMAGIGYMVVYCFLAGEFGAWLLLFLIGAGLLNLPFELMTGQRITRKPRTMTGISCAIGQPRRCTRGYTTPLCRPSGK